MTLSATFALQGWALLEIVNLKADVAAIKAQLTIGQLVKNEN